MLVIDASVVGAVFLPDERTGATDAMRARIAESNLLAPQHWMVEMISLVVNAERRKRISQDQRDALVIKARELEARIDIRRTADWLAVSGLCAVERLSVYDAAYLDLCLVTGAALASNDTDLVAAARRRGITCHSTRP